MNSLHVELIIQSLNGLIDHYVESLNAPTSEEAIFMINPIIEKLRDLKQSIVYDELNRERDSKIEYILIRSQYISSLGEEVTEKLKKGFKLYGDPFVVEDRNANYDREQTTYYCQAVIKRRNPC